MLALFSTASLYGRSSLRALLRGHARVVDERLVFVVGCPRSGTTFVGKSVGAQPGFVDLGEVHPLKKAIPDLVRLSEEETAEKLRQILERVRRLGLVRHLRGVEQTPETSFLLAAALRAYPRACALHVIRDGRDVVCSLLERGWLSAARTGADDVGHPFGPQARFWVEPERVADFDRVSDAARAAYAWRRYVEAVRVVRERTLELRYETLGADPVTTARSVAAQLQVDPEPLQTAFAHAHQKSVARWRRDLTEEQLRAVEAEAAELLEELGYVQSSSRSSSA